MPAIMNPGKQRADHLSEKVRNGTATKEEMAELLHWLERNDDEAFLQAAWETVPDNAYFFDEQQTEQMLRKILPAEPLAAPAPHRRRRMMIPLMAAAMITVIAGIWFFSRRPAELSNETPPIALNSDSSVLRPGGNKATLLLDDGRTIILDSAGNGMLATQGNARISKSNGEVIYNAETTPVSSVSFNTLKTPRGGQYQLTLADGTKVWINAASSLKYPTAFPGNERIVELEGEAYFEVAKDASKPFAVKLNGVEVQVLGTHFNVMAYENEKTVRTTLLEGSVKLSTGRESATLKPGQQGVMQTGSGKLNVTDKVDLSQQVAWKNGYFQFNHTDLASIARQLERWYDIDISFEGTVPDKEFWGKIPMNVNATEVLKILQSSNIHYTIEGKKIIFKP